MYLELLALALKNKFDTEMRTGVHVSDLTLCIRKAAFRRIYPKPTTMLELNFFTSGRAIHDAIQILARSHSNPDQPNMLSELKKELIASGISETSKVFSIVNSIAELRMKNDVGRFEIEKPILYKNIEGHIDLFDKMKNVPIECKTIRSAKIEAPKPHHVEQLKSYLAITNTETGVLLYQLLLNFEDKPFAEFEVSMNESEKKLHLWDLEKKAEAFRNAVDKRDPKLAPAVWDDPTLSWMCRSCPYRQECVKMEFNKDEVVNP